MPMYYTEGVKIRRGVGRYLLADVALEVAQQLVARLQPDAPPPRDRIPHTPGRVVLPTMLYTMLDTSTPGAEVSRAHTCPQTAHRIQAGQCSFQLYCYQRQCLCQASFRTAF